ncbi:hypothetical protein G9C98_003436 [Cotesia typhae]|uniref:Uncharacterized protein n=1 Tax=Cotesia typhae TaxID=2053667 RepID=A0A8J5RG77_9HYME|nr:hypothetical protein G9C98_003436 [Cotesia typhae]
MSTSTLPMTKSESHLYRHHHRPTHTSADNIFTKEASHPRLRTRGKSLTRGLATNMSKSELRCPRISAENRDAIAAGTTRIRTISASADPCPVTETETETKCIIAKIKTLTMSTTVESTAGTVGTPQGLRPIKMTPRPREMKVKFS